MPLQVDVRRMGDVALLKCEGRIVAGDEVQLLQRRVTEVMDGHRNVVLHLGGVTFLDSSGLGLLVRLAGVLRATRGDLKLCSVGSDIAHVLKITNLKQVLETHDSEAEALAAFYGASRHGEAPGSGPRLLCVDASEDVLALLRELARQAGYSAVTTSNLFDARVLARATRPALIVLGPGIGGEERDAIEATIGSTPVLSLDTSFSRLGAADASEQVVSQIRAKLGAS